MSAPASAQPWSLPSPVSELPIGVLTPIVNALPTFDDPEWDMGTAHVANEVRAANAARTLLAHMTQVGDPADDELPIGSAITWFLNDLRHLCDALGVDYDTLADNDMHYAEETGRR